MAFDVSIFPRKIFVKLYFFLKYIQLKHDTRILQEYNIYEKYNTENYLCKINCYYR